MGTKTKQVFWKAELAPGWLWLNSDPNPSGVTTGNMALYGVVNLPPTKPYWFCCAQSYYEGTIGYFGVQVSIDGETPQIQSRLFVSNQNWSGTIHKSQIDSNSCTCSFGGLTITASFKPV